MEKNVEKLRNLAKAMGEILVPTKLTDIISVPIMAVQRGILEVAEEISKQEAQAEQPLDKKKEKEQK